MRLPRGSPLLLLLLAAGCVKTRVASSKIPAAPPSIDSASLFVGDLHYPLDVCRSGDLGYFLGADLEDRRGGAAIRVVMDPLEGPRLRVVLGAGAERRDVVLGPSQCRSFDADVRHTGWHVNTVRDVSGFVDAECTDGGREIRVHARFTHCH